MYRKKETKYTAAPTPPAIMCPGFSNGQAKQENPETVSIPTLRPSLTLHIPRQGFRFRMEANMSHLTGEVVFLIRQFLEEKEFKNAIRWSDYGKAVEMLRKELTVFSVTHDNDLTKMTLLLRSPNFRANAEFSMYGDTKEARSNVLEMLKMSIEENPLFRDKLQLPNIENSRLQRLINQSLKWQHHHCKNPKPHPGVQTLYVDHSCGQIYGARAPSGVTTQLVSCDFPPHVAPGAGTHVMFHTLGGPKGLSARDNTGNLDDSTQFVDGIYVNHPSSTNPEMVYHTADYESVQKRARHLQSVDENEQSHTWPLVNHGMTGEMAKSRVWKPEEMSEQSQLHFLRLPDTSSSAQITRLIYTDSGEAILALAYNGLHKLWKWHRNEQNRDGKATVKFLPELWRPATGRLMINDLSMTKPEDAVACLALTNNDAFVISGSGGKVSVFSIITFMICVWSTEVWNDQANKPVHISSGRGRNPPRKNRVQFHQDQIHLLVFNETLIAVYEAPELKCIEQWFRGHSTGPITCATYSCDSQSVYAAFESGDIIVFSAALVLQCKISPEAYLTSSPRKTVYPLAIAAHPRDPSQFALGLNDGGVLVLEPLDQTQDGVL
uniref:CTLH domain-containing protein n=1 Tax=Daucus carota subsp. sativus TaxID=79200 RepID=A0A164XDC1_DAUCS